eukprot:TRINITY_DN111129_c0_g1_i1.p1 TRINITY_DN111129_c0_g1~~TRINITY_DN111129_c0_g1_i1.p1  ORF type:complete len:257 (+),score=18.19 TRINITY_DN111129_c0_g1_i1:49-819(+)
MESLAARGAVQRSPSLPASISRGLARTQPEVREWRGRPGRISEGPQSIIDRAQVGRLLAYSTRAAAPPPIPEVPRILVDPSARRSVPLPSVSYGAQSSGVRFPAECSICFEAFHPGEEAKALPCNGSSGCQSLFHPACIQRWFSKCARCPLCRCEYPGLGPLRLQAGDPDEDAGDHSPVPPNSAEQGASIRQLVQRQLLHHSNGPSSRLQGNSLQRLPSLSSSWNPYSDQQIQMQSLPSSWNPYGNSQMFPSRSHC